MSLVASFDRIIEVKDTFKAHIQVPYVDFGGDRSGRGSGDVQYNLAIFVEPQQVSVFGSMRLDASMQGSDGKHLEFHGSAAPYQYST